MDFSTAIPTFVITLREGVEAALVVGIVLAYLQKANQSRLNLWVYSGVGVGIAISILIGILFSGIMGALATSGQPYATVFKPLLEGVFCSIAIVLLSWMLVWMTQQAKFLKTEVEGAIATLLTDSGLANSGSINSGSTHSGSTASPQGAGWGVFGLILIAVLREGFETVLFISAQFQQGWSAAMGAIAGLLGATGIGFLLFQLGVKINLRRFFQVMGILLLLIVSGLVVTALRKFDGAAQILASIDPHYGWLCPPADGSCFLGAQIWDASQVLPDRQFPGVLLKAFFGYTQRLYAVQAIAYLVFLGTVGTAYFRSLTPQPRTISTPTPESVDSPSP